MAQLAPPEFPPERGARPSERRPALPEFREPRAPVLPPLPMLPPVMERPSAGLTIAVREIRLQGNRVFSDADLAPLLAEYEDREVAAEDLLELRDRITRRYVEAGYINSGAVIPDQDVRDGIVTIDIIEGELDEVRITGAEILREGFLEGRIRASAEPVLNVDRLQEELQRLLAEPTVDRLDARLGPGAERGRSRLEVDVDEARRFTSALQFDNDRSPSVGELQGEVEVVARSVLGFNDPAFARFDVTDGLRDIAFGYNVPLTTNDLRLRVFGEYIDADVVEEPFDQLDIESESYTLEIGLRQPLIRGLNNQFSLGVDFVRRHSRTTLLGDPFPIARDGESDITALRFIADGLARSRNDVVALRSTLSVGLDTLGATGGAPGFDDDGQFVAWLAQGQYARRFTERGDEVILRADVQLAADPLLPLEQIAIGGLDSVRGYRRSALVRDNGVVASIEGRFPLFDLPIPELTRPTDDPSVRLAPFADVGHGWNSGDRGPPGRASETISSIGIGALWNPSSRLAISFYYGYAFDDLTRSADDSLQDQGIHFQIQVIPF